ncbi:hypothetical protein Nepgr_017822 [Nepenthes gracilis]|uniref:Uncharacterized protein n=1 Tax=Nepenthes gracilis TaxID=150966 RepID=A0AAD3STE8_NEPGR|nr:hypothetical protein Nepgr_017822 [Nepenthes gracilis]
MAACLRLPSALPSPKPKPLNTANHRPRVTIRCGPRDKRGPLVKGRILSTEAILAIQALKRAHNGSSTTRPEVDGHHLHKTLSRLIKSDLVATLNELLRQGRCDLALKVFSAVRSESWYKTDLGMYADLVSALGKQGKGEDIDRLICELEEEEGNGVIDCQDKGLVKLIRALIGAERRESTVRIYGMMKRSGWGSTGSVDEYGARALSRGFRRFGEEGLADEVDLAFERFSKRYAENI